MEKRIKEIIEASIDTKSKILADQKLQKTVADCVSIITASFKNGNKVLFCGNGGSAADAQHLAAEFSGRFYKDRKALPSEALHCNTSYLTAVANDYSYDVIYSRLLEGVGAKGDVLVGLSTSGNSKNILNAFAVAKTMGITTIAFTGESGGKMKDVCDYLINVPSADTPRIQESHIMLGHIVCELVELNIFG
ncbi:MAG: D-sedoheptulose 7-phosphate isomerase [Chitinophagaceae bacterium]|nr:D-sedoheptulose 7-phosphate isomerase [Bacteroidota bacterium]TAJ52840.1 MAG: D-sedoheptulose 7-phosphate isomerase [Chitinophagaceae bacterium]